MEQDDSIPTHHNSFSDPCIIMRLMGADVGRLLAGEAGHLCLLHSKPFKAGGVPLFPVPGLITCHCSRCHYSCHWIISARTATSVCWDKTRLHFDADDAFQVRGNFAFLCYKSTLDLVCVSAPGIKFQRVFNVFSTLNPHPASAPRSSLRLLLNNTHTKDPLPLRRSLHRPL